MIERDAYAWTKEHIGLKEIPGPLDTRLIEVAHRLCFIEGPRGGTNTDEIPWCSSWVNLAIVVANIKRNPGAGFQLLKEKSFELDFINEVFNIANVDFKAMRSVNTGQAIVSPTWSASSLSWDKWGGPVFPENARRGDIVRLTRAGGGHVAFLDEDYMGLINVQLLGGNQGDTVKASIFPFNRVVSIRRAML